MNRRPIDWNRYVPLGMDGKKTVKRMAMWLGVGIGSSVLFPVRYSSARSSLWGYVNGKYQRIDGIMMLSFGELMEGVFLPMAVIAFGFAIFAAIMYLYHYQGSRSIYTMKRLPDRWELWRRCLTTPVLFLLLSGLCTLILIGLYYLIWRFATPLDALPL